MTQTITIGQFGGITIRAHGSWALLPPAVAIYSLAVETVGEAVFNVLLLLAVYGCVLLHEAGLFLAARRFHLRPHDVVLYPFWATSKFTHLSDRPWQEIYIAIAGPIVHGLLAAAIGCVLVLSGRTVEYRPELTEPLGETFAVHLLWANVFLVVLHLLPILPLDMGRLLRAGVAGSLSRLRATEIMAVISTVGAIALLVAAVVWFRSPLIGTVAVLLFLAAQDDLGTTRYFASLRHRPNVRGSGRPSTFVPLDQIVTADCRPMEPNFSGFTWNSKARLWVEWHDGQPVSASALIGDGH